MNENTDCPHQRSAIVLATFVLLFTLFKPLLAHEDKPTSTDHPVKTMRAKRINPHPPEIDGLLDDPIWAHTPPFSEFTQRDPDEGAPASEQTIVQIAYDHEALYIGIMAHDTEPDRIIGRLTRRDGRSNSDRISLYLDPYHDHQTGYYFSINPAGAKGDAYLYNDTRRDSTWDGIWKAEAAVHDAGWSAEYKIPYHTLKFNPKPRYTWGINVVRTIQRKNERDYWVLRRRREGGRVSRFGHLEGIAGIKPKTHVELLPFAVGRTTVETKSTEENRPDLFSTFGADLRYDLTTNFSLNATVNPDFGQVEADPEVLNLSVFESFFEERRPFFVQGATIFDTPINLFYSRRIGKRPGHFSIPDGLDTVDRPEFTNILGAAKLTGKTAGRTTFGILEAVTSREYATIEERGVDRQHLVEPLSNYFVGRVKQDILDGNSAVGALLTGVHRREAESAYTGGVDWNLRLRNRYQVTGQVAASRTGDIKARKNGYAVNLQMNKISGWLRTYFDFDAISPAFDINDIGFQRRSDRIRSRLWLGLWKQRPWGISRRSYINIVPSGSWNYDGVNLEKSLRLDVRNQFKNFWWFRFGAIHDFETLDDLVTRGGPLMVQPAETRYFLEIESDSRYAVGGESQVSWGGDNAGGKSWSIDTRLRLNPTSNVELRIGPEYRWRKSDAQWVTNVDSNGDGEDDHFVFGELTSRVIDLTTKLSVSFTRDLSLQFYLQPFITVGDYKDFKELARPESYALTPYVGEIDNPDFNRRSLNSNLVLRWEYRPGSTLFVVWSQSRRASDADPELDFFDSLGHTFVDDGENILLVKLNYWLGL